MSVLVTDGASRQALAIVRSLGRRGIRTVVGDTPRRNLASVSRYCNDTLPLPSPTKDPRRFQKLLPAAAVAGGIEVVMPVSDAAVSSIFPVRDEMERHLRVFLPEEEAYKRATDKARLLDLAAELGIPVPRTLKPAGLDEVGPAARELGWPVVVKPRRSKVELRDQWLDVLVGYAHTQAELLKKWTRVHDIAPLPLLQERITGPGMGVFVLAQQGRIVVLFAHRRLREKPPSGGVSVLRESVTPDSSIVRDVTRLIEALSWTGVAMVEFKQDLRDGLAKLMEINARWWGSLQLAVDAGLDFPYLVYRTALGDRTIPGSRFGSGVRTRWLLGDLDHLLSVWLLPRRRLSVSQGHPGRFRTLWNFLTAFGTARTEVLRLVDLRPFLHEARIYALRAPRVVRDILSGRLPRSGSVRGG